MPACIKNLLDNFVQSLSSGKLFCIIFSEFKRYSDLIRAKLVFGDTGGRFEMCDMRRRGSGSGRALVQVTRPDLPEAGAGGSGSVSGRPRLLEHLQRREQGSTGYTSCSPERWAILDRGREVGQGV